MQSRDFTFIDNAVAANLLGAGMDPVTGEVWETNDEPRFVAANIGIGERYTLLDVVEALNAILGTSIEPVFEPTRIGDVRDSQAAIDVARDQLGYEPLVSFQEGLERTVESFLSASSAERATA
jgi:UDP-glucose 4-epimerase